MTPHVIDAKTYVKAQFHAETCECAHVDCGNRQHVSEMVAWISGNQEEHGVYLFCSYTCLLFCACTTGEA